AASSTAPVNEAMSTKPRMGLANAYRSSTSNAVPAASNSRPPTAARASPAAARSTRADQGLSPMSGAGAAAREVFCEGRVDALIAWLGHAPAFVHRVDDFPPFRDLRLARRGHRVSARGGHTGPDFFFLAVKGLAQLASQRLAAGPFKGRTGLGRQRIEAVLAH